MIGGKAITAVLMTETGSAACQRGLDYIRVEMLLKNTRMHTHMHKYRLYLEDI